MTKIIDKHYFTVWAYSAPSLSLSFKQSSIEEKNVYYKIIKNIIQKVQKIIIEILGITLSTHLKLNFSTKSKRQKHSRWYKNKYIKIREGLGRNM